VCQRDDVLAVAPYVNASQPGGGGNDLFNFAGQQDATSLLVYDAIMSAQLQLNGHERTLDHPAVYYRTVQPWQRTFPWCCTYLVDR
jgi:hypothetical protein